MSEPIRAVPVRVAAGVVAAVGLLLLSGCTPTVKVKHEVEPIHLTADINIRVDRELDEFFAFQDQAATTQPGASSTTQTAQAAEGDLK